MNTSNSRSISGGLKASLALGGLSLSLGALYLVYQNRRKQGVAELDMSREMVIRILREFRREFFPIIRQILTSADNVRDKLAMRRIPPAEMASLLYEMLVINNPSLKIQVEDLEARIYAKYDIVNAQQFERLCEELAKTDSRVRELMTDMKGMLPNAVMGMIPANSVELPSNVTHQLILRIYAQTVKAVLAEILNYSRAFTERKGEISLEDPEFALGLNGLNITGIKTRVITENGIDGTEDVHPQQILSAALVKFKRESNDFAGKLLRVEELNKRLMEILMRPGVNFKAVEERLPEFDAIVEPQDLQIMEEVKPLETPADLPLQVEDSQPAAEAHILDVEVKEDDVIPVSRGSKTPASKRSKSPAVPEPAETEHLDTLAVDFNEENEAEQQAQDPEEFPTDEQL